VAHEGAETLLTYSTLNDDNPDVAVRGEVLFLISAEVVHLGLRLMFLESLTGKDLGMDALRYNGPSRLFSPLAMNT
jgi:uncharacterized protein Smg (DUF494 family)